MPMRVSYKRMPKTRRTAQDKYFTPRFADDLEAALEQFGTIAEDLKK